jgi:hypothetical protein
MSMGCSGIRGAQGAPGAPGAPAAALGLPGAAQLAARTRWGAPRACLPPC